MENGSKFGPPLNNQNLEIVNISWKGFVFACLSSAFLPPRILLVALRLN